MQAALQSPTGAKVIASNRKRRRTNDASTISPHVRPLPPISDPILNPPLSPGLPNFNAPFRAPQTSAHDHNGDAQAFAQHSLSPSFTFSPWASHLSLAPGILDTGQTPHQLDNFFGLPQTFEQQTPGGMSASGSTHTEGDKDPFMSLLEQLAENEQSHGGPSDLDFFLGAQS